MFKTCSKCKHYCSNLNDSDSLFHLHNYCKVWRSQIPDGKGKEMNGVIYDDIETENAGCWLWEPNGPCLKCKKYNSYSTDCKFCNKNNYWRLYYAL